MKRFCSTRWFLSLAVFLTLLAALCLPTPAYAEGDLPAAEDPAPSETQEEIPAEMPAEETAAPAVEVSVETAPEVETPVAAPVEEESTPEDSSTQEPVAQAEAGDADEEEVNAQYNIDLDDNVYFYDAAKVAHYYDSILSAYTAFVVDGGKGMIYVSDKGSPYADVLTINTTANLTGIGFLDYYPSEAAKYEADTFDVYDSSTWAQISGTITINDMPNFTLAGFKIALNSSSNYAVQVINDNGVTGTLNLSYLDISNAGSGGGLDITHTGKVNITNVKSTSASGNGSAVIDDDGTVTVASSKFSGAGTGLTITATNLVTLTGVSAGGNTGNGASLIASRGAIIKNSVFSDNDEDGLFYEQDISGTLTIENTQFNDNDVIGLDAPLVYGNISLKNVRADHNGMTGFYADSCDEDAGSCLNPNSGNITVVKSNFNTNGQLVTGYGVQVKAKGSIIFTSVRASENGYIKAGGETESYGVYLENNYSPAKNPITLTDCEFNDNRYDGLNAYSAGAITLKDVSASGNLNAEYGARLENADSGNTAGISILNSTGRVNNFNNNEASIGLYIITNGMVTISSVNASNNASTGAEINNAGSGKSLGVTIKNSNFNKNIGHGLLVVSKGAIALTNVEAAENGTYGASLVNNTSPTNAGVTITGQGDWDRFDANGSYGLDILTQGKITISNVDISDNQDYGLNVDNDGGSVAQPVSISNATINNNVLNGSLLYYGLYVTSKGAITLKNVQVNGNGDADGDKPVEAGAYLINTASTTKAGITLTDVTFSDNYGNATHLGDGVKVFSEGVITIKNLKASNNHQYGAYLFNQYDGFDAGISILSTGVATNWITDNGGTGLYVKSNGAITLANLLAEDNGDADLEYGVYLSNFDSDDAVASKITVSNCTVNNNGNSGGLVIDANGAVTLSNIIANDNVAYGISVSNTHFTNQNITLTNLDAVGNIGTGIFLNTWGNVIARDLLASSNTGDGLSVTTDSAIKSYGSVTLSGINYFNGNTFEGLYIDIGNFGSFMASGVTAESNGGDGMYVDASSANAGKITINSSDLNHNGNKGLDLNANNTIMLNTIYALNNGVVNSSDGISILQNNTTAATTLQNSILLWNTESGLEMDTSGGLNPVIKNTITFGNNADNTGSENDVYIHN